ncbi:PTS beta-glucoside transporter subunit IIABC, partial [Bacillus thuringiensis]|nr:PTS beta-glucoside transporter subunit IIABC [Bacillus thuringiensis]
FVLPFLTLLIVVPVTFLVICPIATCAGQFLGQATLWLYNSSALVAGALLGAFWQVLVIFGLHWGVVPIGFNNLAVHGIDPI